MLGLLESAHLLGQRVKPFFPLPFSTIRVKFWLGRLAVLPKDKTLGTCEEFSTKHSGNCAQMRSATGRTVTIASSLYPMALNLM